MGRGIDFRYPCIRQVGFSSPGLVPISNTMFGPQTSGSREHEHDYRFPRREQTTFFQGPVVRVATVQEPDESPFFESGGVSFRTNGPVDRRRLRIFGRGSDDMAHPPLPFSSICASGQQPITIYAPRTHPESASVRMTYPHSPSLPTRRRLGASMKRAPFFALLFPTIPLKPSSVSTPGGPSKRRSSRCANSSFPSPRSFPPAGLNNPSASYSHR
ncbi:hypothetical protein C8Q74DRAFT_1232760 [Fomes fomentarius]|nr:hypothetical protein C8Q74DRAFT_1232760 [Fomes fomentarius]